MTSKYVLITPARNEAKFIDLTLQSVVSQTIKPVRWVIVSDGSSDGTDEIVQKYSSQYTWIELVCLPEHRDRDFARKVGAFNAGYARVTDVPYDVIGCLDADISFDPGYFSFLLNKSYLDPSLGVFGTPFKDTVEGAYDYRFVNIEHVSGACQLFRRECFESIGGYIPLKGGSIDHTAVITARMKGWKTRTFTEKVCFHHRQVGTAQANALRARFNYGVKDYNLGNHPIWEMSRTFYQMTKRPKVLGGLAIGAGYVWACLRGNQRLVSPELVRFHRHEQINRLKTFIRMPSFPRTFVP